MKAKKSVVAAGHELTAKAAAEILQDGGNAFDACVAGLFMTFVAEAVFASPGGGGFLMARREESDAVSLFDFVAETPRKRRPSSQIDFYPIYADFGPAKQEFHIGLGSSATPGMVPGIVDMHEALCRLPMTISVPKMRNVRCSSVTWRRTLSANALGSLAASAGYSGVPSLTLTRYCGDGAGTILKRRFRRTSWSGRRITESPLNSSSGCARPATTACRSTGSLT